MSFWLMKTCVKRSGKVVSELKLVRILCCFHLEPTRTMFNYLKMSIIRIIIKGMNSFFSLPHRVTVEIIVWILLCCKALLKFCAFKIFFMSYGLMETCITRFWLYSLSCYIIKLACLLRYFHLEPVITS